MKVVKFEIDKTLFYELRKNSGFRNSFFGIKDSGISFVINFGNSYFSQKRIVST